MGCDQAAIPEDLDEFWSEITSEAAAAPLNYRRRSQSQIQTPGFEVEEIEFSVAPDRSLHGWIAYPPGARRLPGFLWIAPYGRESMLPNEYGTREGFASMSFNFHGESAFHREKYESARGYFAHGAEAPETWIFRQMARDAMIAARVFQAQIEVDEDRIGAMGMSQGGGMSIWLGALSPIVRAVCADMPFLGCIRDTLSGRVYRYPLKELAEFMDTIPIGHERVHHTVSYYDTSVLATRCKVPTQVALGQKDPASRPPSVEAIFEALPGPKLLQRYSVGHEWTPEMIENNRAWLLENLP